MKTMTVQRRLTSLHVAFFSLAVAVGLGTLMISDASANGRFPASTNAAFQAGDDQLIVLPTTFGLLLSEDDGNSFHWVCEKTIGYGGTYDPDYAVAVNGDIYATTFDGVQVSRDGGCTFGDTEFIGDLTGGQNPVLLEPGYFVSEVELASDGKIWAATSTGDNTNNIYVSTDGSAFLSTNAFQEKAWWKSLRVSKSNPNIVYAAGYEVGSTRRIVFDAPTRIEVATGPIPTGGLHKKIERITKPAKALLFKTIDGGATWNDLGVADFSFGRQPNIVLEGISPTDPDVVYIRVLAARDPEGDDLYRSADGGVTWTKVLEMHGVISAFVVRSDGSVIAGMATPCAEDFGTGADASVPFKGCVRTSPTGEAGTWVKPAVEPKLGCLGERAQDNQLFGCGHNWDPDNFALGISDDGAQSWTKVMRFGEIAGPLSCPNGTTQQTCEVEDWPALCVMLGICSTTDIDAGPGGSADSGVTGEADAGESTKEPGACGCQSTTPTSVPLSLVWLLAIYAIGFRRKRSQ